MSETTDHGTRDTGRHALNGAPSSATLAVRAAVEPLSRPVEDTERRTVQRDAGQVTGTERPAAHHKPSRFRRWREARALTAEQQAEAARAAKLRRDTERDAAQQRAEDLRTAAARAAVRARQTSRSNGTPAGTRAAAEIAPIPRQMVWVGVWLGRTFGALPLVAPLLVSGFFTTQVFRDDPISSPFLVALLVTGALEGGVFKLVNLYTATLLEGDSTIGLRVGIAVYLGMISGLIYWHAWHTARVAAEQAALAAGMTRGQVADAVAQADLGWGWLPAAGCAAFSFLGVYIWGREARFTHRVNLRKQGKVDGQVPKFSTLSWILCWIETPQAVRHAVKYRLERPVDAVNDLRYYKAAGKPNIWPELTEAEIAAICEPPDDGTATAAHGTRMFRDPLDAFEADLADGTARSALPAVPRPAATDGTGAAPSRAVPQGHTAHGTARNADTGAARNGTGNGTFSRSVDGTEGAPQAGGTRRGTEDGDVAEPGLLRYTEHILAITEAHPDWQRKLPSIREGIAAVDGSRKRINPDAGFNSTSTIRKVLDAMARLADDPDIAQALAKLRTQNTTNGSARPDGAAR